METLAEDPSWQTFTAFIVSGDLSAAVQMHRTIQKRQLRFDILLISGWYNRILRHGYNFLNDIGSILDVYGNQSRAIVRPKQGQRLLAKRSATNICEKRSSI